VRTLVLATLVGSASLAGFQASAQPLSQAARSAVVSAHEWHSGCPVTLSQLRVLTVAYHGFDGRSHTGQLVVNSAAVAPLTQVFRRLYALHFPIHHMNFSDTYGPSSGQPADGDVTASFECRQASASPCNGIANKGTGSWSMHAYGLAIDINPVENPYVGCGMTRDKTALSYLDRSRVRRGMVTPAVLEAFRSVGWGWGGSWSGSTKDYMHFSSTGH
jgi:D-alanyl-D-alanine carboxypeptidase-like protein